MKPVNKGTTQGRVYSSLPFQHLSHLNITLGNHDVLFNADASTIIPPVWKEVHYSDQLVSQFLDYTSTNAMPCNPRKCKELTTKKRDNYCNCNLFTPTKDDTKL